MADYYWVATYGENDFLPQYNEDGTENGYGDIDRSRLVEFHVRDRETDRAVFAMELSEGQRLVFRRRNSINGNTGEVNWTVLLVGWQKNVNGTNVQSLHWIFPDGTIVNTGKYNEHHQVFYEVQYLPFELEDA